jgi:heat shock protein HslJ
VAGIGLRGVLLLAAAVVSLPGCAGAADGGTPRPAPEAVLVGSWELVEVSRDGAAVPLPGDGGGMLVIESGGLRGQSFCNSFSGSYRLRGGALAIGGLGGTEMSCAPDVMAAEQAYLTALGGADTAAVRDGELVLSGQGAELRFGRLPAKPVSDLVGTRWVLETLLQDDMASSPLGEPAVLVLAADGGVSGSTGCRPLAGRWARTGDTLVFSELRADGDCAAEVRVQDEHVRTVLDGEKSAVVDGDLLTITGRDGRALVYRAA